MKKSVCSVSIIIPMRNAELYIADTINSIISQNWNNMEIIIVNDGSLDQSEKIVKSFSDNRIKLFQGPSKGVSAVWNEGFHISSGDIIISSDADDIIPPGSIRRRIEFLIEHGEYGAVCGGFSTIDNHGHLIANLWDTKEIGLEITNELRNAITRTHFCTFAVRRKYIEALKGKRNFFESAEDIDLQFRIGEHCRVWFEPVEMYQWRLHNHSLTHTQGSPRRIFFEEYARELSRQRSESGIDDVDRGCPLIPPEENGRPYSVKKQIRGMQIGNAWRLFINGKTSESIMLTFRILYKNKFNIDAWRTLIIMLLKTLLLWIKSLLSHRF